MVTFLPVKCNVLINNHYRHEYAKYYGRYLLIIIIGI